MTSIIKKDYIINKIDIKIKIGDKKSRELDISIINS